MEIIKLPINSIVDIYNGYKFHEADFYDIILNTVKKYGQVKNIVVYEEDKKYFILDGYYVYKALKETGSAVISVCVVPKDDMLVLSLNTYLREDFILLYRKVNNMLKSGITIAEICNNTIYTENEIKQFEKLLDYNFTKYSDKLHVLYNTELTESYF